jgi:hypothetical protein
MGQVPSQAAPAAARRRRGVFKTLSGQKQLLRDDPLT